MNVPGNFVSEWFGYRTFPDVYGGREALDAQRNDRCPFLSSVTREERRCIKAPTSLGICTISSSSNKTRQDWLVCPYRALDDFLIESTVRRLFGIERRRAVHVVPAPTLVHASTRLELSEIISSGGAAFTYLEAKLGGEISVSATDRSPEFSFDFTVVEIVRGQAGLGMGRFGVLEVQTMDFHGTYREAASNLRDALRLHGQQFPEVLRGNPHWLSERVEGPNIANVFKRTFYQMMLKFQVGAHERSAGTALALPQAVWDSWQRHLGMPELSAATGDTYQLRHPESKGDQPGAWIIVFDIQQGSSTHPNPLVITRMIQTDAESLAHYALRVVPELAFGEAGAASFVISAISRRLARWWPELVEASDA